MTAPATPTRPTTSPRANRKVSSLFMARFPFANGENTTERERRGDEGADSPPWVRGDACLGEKTVGPVGEGPTGGGKPLKLYQFAPRTGTPNTMESARDMLFSTSKRAGRAVELRFRRARRCAPRPGTVVPGMEPALRVDAQIEE